MIGKYSPTVCAAYSNNQDWWRKNGGEDPSNEAKPFDIYGYDRDGYDSYGYDKDNVDRADNHEDDYPKAGVYDDGNSTCDLFELAYSKWGIDQHGFPKLKEK